MSAHLPMYQRIGQVRACKIASIERTEDGFQVWPADKTLDPFPVPFAYVTTKSPKPGGYCILQDNGFYDFAPARVFEAEHLQVDELADRHATLTKQLAEVNAAIAANERTKTP